MGGNKGFVNNRKSGQKVVMRNWKQAPVPRKGTTLFRNNRKPTHAPPQRSEK